MAKKYEDKLKKHAEDAAKALAEQAEKDAAALRQAQQDYQTNTTINTDKLTEAGNNASSTVANAQVQQQKNWEDAISAFNKSNEDAVSESVKQENHDRKIAAWTGAGELASALANLVGVANGASNQTFRTYSQDWMRKADEEREKRKSRMDNIRERQLQMSQQLANLKAGNAESLAKFQYDLAAKNAERSDKAAGVAYDAAVKAQGITSGAANKGIELGYEAGVRGSQLDVQEEHYNNIKSTQDARLRVQETRNRKAIPIATTKADGTTGRYSVHADAYDIMLLNKSEQIRESLSPEEQRQFDSDLAAAKLIKGVREQVAVLKRYAEKSPDYDSWVKEIAYDDDYAAQEVEEAEHTASGTGINWGNIKHN